MEITRKPALRWALVTCLIGAASCAAHLRPMPSVASAPPLDLALRIEALARSIDPHMRLGVKVVTLDGTPVVELHAEQRFVPASTLKLFTAAAALHALGPGHQFITDLLVEDLPEGAHRLGEVYLRGSGDSQLSQDDVVLLVAALRQQGVVAIGGLVLDETHFDNTHWGHAWAWDDRNDYFSAPIEALNLAGNTLELSVKGASVPGGPGRVQASPNVPYGCVINETVTVLAPGSGSIALDTPGTNDISGLTPDQCVRITGVAGVDAVSQIRKIAVSDGALFVAAAFTDALQKQGISMHGTIRRGKTPPDAQVIATHASAPLTSQLTDFLKVSDNHGMECLVKRMGALSHDGGGTWKDGMQVTTQILRDEFQLDASSFAMVDGSGLSRKDLITPAAATDLLTRVYRDLTLGPVYLAMLPAAGIDGTLAQRFAGSPLKGRVRAKTGTMGGISSLAGVMTTTDHQPLIFAIIMNNFVGPLERYRRLQEEILRLVDEGR